jgi:uncharacterized protein YndB with AHSA1/START domain
MEIRDSAKKDYWGRGTYIEVKPPEKIVFTWSWSKEAPGTENEKLYPEGPVTEVIVEFFVRGGKTDLVLTHRGLGSQKAREDHETGWIGCLNELENTLA